MTFPLEGIFGNNAAANEKKTTGRLGLQFLIGFRAREKNLQEAWDSVKKCWKNQPGMPESSLWHMKERFAES